MWKRHFKCVDKSTAMRKCNSQSLKGCRYGLIQDMHMAEEKGQGSGSQFLALWFASDQEMGLCRTYEANNLEFGE
jgi:hypothetical protein